MQRLMLRLDALLRRRRRLVIGLWLLALLAAAPLALKQSDNLTGGGFEAPASPSVGVERTVEREFPGATTALLLAVVVPTERTRAGDLERALTRVERAVGEVERVEVSADARRRALAAARQRADRPVVLRLDLDGDESFAIDVARDLREELDIAGGDPGRAAGGRVNVHLGGQGAMWAAFQEVAQADVRVAESRAFPIIALVLLAAFGSLAAAALPLGLGVAAVVVTGALIYLISRQTEMSIYVTNVASMIGIGVAVDYSLFILARYREELRAGRGPEQARAAAMATSGVAVLFSGLTVIASIAGLFLVDTTALRSMAIGAILVVAISMLAAATLLPALIAVLGHRVEGRGRWLRARRRHAAGERSERFWSRWTERVMRRPVISVIGASAILLLLAAPAVDLRMQNSGGRQLDEGHEIRVGARAAASVEGPGALGPVRVLAELHDGTTRDPANLRAVHAVRAAMQRDPGVADVQAARTAPDGRSVLFTTILRSDPEADVSRTTVHRLRDTLPPVAGPRADVAVGGTTATLVDFDELVSGAMWKIMLFVLALSFVVLLVLLRSIVLPLKAVLMNILSVTAAYGVLVAVFQWGWLEFLGLEASPSIDTVTPPLVLALAFGLSMDYEVFLLSRIRERYAATGDNRRAVAEGLASSAHTITSAALIMVAVFLAFVSAGLPSVQRLGLAAAVAIAVDATIVRLVLVPAAMELLGKWNWWLPRPLARMLPPVNLEAVKTY